jgi:hypothetical protein
VVETKPRRQISSSRKSRTSLSDEGKPMRQVWQALKEAARRQTCRASFAQISGIINRLLESSSSKRDLLIPDDWTIEYSRIAHNAYGWDPPNDAYSPINMRYEIQFSLCSMRFMHYEHMHYEQFNCSSAHMDRCRSER